MILCADGFAFSGLLSGLVAGCLEGLIPIVIKCCALHKEQRAIPKLRLRLPPVVCAKYTKRSNLIQLVR